MTKNIDLSTTVAGVNLESYIINASGPDCTTYEELQTIARSESAAVMMKSCTVEPREGNPEPRYQRLDFGAIQSMGLPNLGYKEYVKFSAQLRQEYGKPVIASLSGMCKEDNLKMVEAFQESPVDMIEVNFSCPNIVGKPQLGYDFEQTDKVLGEICKINSKPIGVKLPPYFDLCHFDMVAEIMLKHKVGFISCINSIGNTLIIDAETEAPIIKPKGGFGGLSGQYIKPVGLSNVRAFLERLKGQVAIFGVGGIVTGTDAFEYLLAGADAVQIGTTFEKEGAASFSRIAQELQAIMQRKGYSSIAEAKGKLREL
ncbi:MAG: dihydroorotate oxidase [Gammaproteobacteria bacterium]|nr:MAG: dihydroorotate oxidase [Gammaproteobacteria bacterium]